MLLRWLSGNASVYVYLHGHVCRCSLLLRVSVCVLYCLLEGRMNRRDPEPELQRPAVCELILTL